MIQVVKIGGNIVDNAELLENFARDFAALEGKKILIHGGGALASKLQKDMGLIPNMIEGRRVTDEDTLKVVTMVYAGWCNKNITALLQTNGCNAIGLSGADANVIKATKREPLWIESLGESVDFGYVGDIEPRGVNAKFLISLLDQGLTPVLCAINHDGKGQLLNTNADTVASSVAIAVANYKYRAAQDVCSSCEEYTHCSDDGRLTYETRLIYCFEKEGVLYDKDDDNSIITKINLSTFEKLKQEGVVADGMLPKLSNSFKAIESGVSKVIIKHAKNLLNDKGTTLL